MIFPHEYKHIGFHLSETPSPDPSSIYFLSQYVLEKNADGYCLYQVRHAGAGFLRRVVSSEILASADEIVSYDKIVNIKNRTFLIEKAAEMCARENEKRPDAKKVTTVLFTGIDRHITFVKDPDVSVITEIEVMDIFPPNPPWLIDCIRRLDQSQIFGDLEIRFVEKAVDISVYQGEKTIYPCRASGLKGKFLDTDKIDEQNCLLVGCDTSRQVFEALYPHLSYEFVDLCPMRSTLMKPSGPFIMRCCKSENSGKIVQINGQTGVIVHWGSNEHQISESVRKLAAELKGKKEKGDEKESGS